MKKVFKFLLLILICAASANTIQAQSVKTNGKTDQKSEIVDSAAMKTAIYITNLAKADIVMTDEEADFLQEALYIRYKDGKVRTKNVNDKAKVAEIKSSVHKEFSQSLYKYFGKERSAEIIAWFYNYTNKKIDK